MEDVKTKLLHQMHDEFQKMKIGMTESFRRLEANLNHMVDIVREMKAGEGRVNGGTASQPATQIMKVAAHLQVLDESMELYNQIYGAPIFDVYDDEAVPFSHIYGDGDLAVQGCSSFVSSPRNYELSKEPIDVSHDEALIAQFWSWNVAHKTHWHANSALSRPEQSHEPLIPTPKKLSQENPVSGKPPPLRDKKVVQSYVAMEKKHNMIINACHVVSNLEDKVIWRVEY